MESRQVWVAEFVGFADTVFEAVDAGLLFLDPRFEVAQLARVGAVVHHAEDSFDLESFFLKLACIVWERVYLIEHRFGLLELGFHY